MASGADLGEIFFSYSSKDRERVRPFHEALTALGFEVFWDMEVPPGVEQIILRLLEKKPDARFRTPNELAAALEPYCRGATGMAERALAPTNRPEKGEFDWNTLAGPEDEEQKPSRRKARTLEKTEVVPEEQLSSTSSPRAAARGSGAPPLLLLYAGIGLLLLLGGIGFFLFRSHGAGGEPKGTSKEGGLGGPALPTTKKDPRPDQNDIPPPVLPTSYAGPFKASDGFLPAGNLGAIKQVAFLPDGRKGLVVGSVNHFALFDLATCEKLTEFRGHTNVVTSAAISRDGRRLISGSRDNSVRLWNPDTGQEIKKIPGQMAGGLNWVRSVAISPDGKYALWGGTSNIVVLWDLDQDKLVRRLEGPNGVFQVAFSANGAYSACAGNGSICIWKTGTEMKSFPDLLAPGNIHCLAFSPDGRTLVSGHDPGTGIKVWDLANNKEKIILKQENDPQTMSVAVSPTNPDLIASCGSYSQVVLWNAQLGRPAHLFVGQGQPIYSVVFSSDGQRLLSGSMDGSVRVWELPK